MSGSNDVKEEGTDGKIYWNPCGMAFLKRGDKDGDNSKSILLKLDLFPNEEIVAFPRRDRVPAIRKTVETRPPKLLSIGRAARERKIWKSENRLMRIKLQIDELPETSSSSVERRLEHLLRRRDLAARIVQRRQERFKREHDLEVLRHMERMERLHGWEASIPVPRTKGMLRSCLAAVMQALVACRCRAPDSCGAGSKRVTVRQKSVLSGQLNEMDLDLDPNALEWWLAAPRAERPFLRDAFPNLSDDEREFLLTGSTPEEWERHFGEDK